MENFAEDTARFLAGRCPLKDKRLFIFYCLRFDTVIYNDIILSCDILLVKAGILNTLGIFPLSCFHIRKIICVKSASWCLGL